MALATSLHLCIDVNDLDAQTAFWARTLGLRPDPARPVLHGATPQHDVWLNVVPEPHAVKNRMHLDLWAPSLDQFSGLPRLTEPGQFRWTTLADPEGNEFCVFVDPALAAPRLKDVVVDAADPQAIATWWQGVLGGTLTDGEGEWSLSGVGGGAFEDVDFVPVPEPRTVKNRVHWDVRLAAGASVADLVAAGARVLRLPDDDIFWTVLADPEGNEFCVFEAEA